MAETDFDGLAALTGEIKSVEIIDFDGNPNKVLDSENPFDIKVKWTVSPASTAVLLDGTWTVRAFAESVGPGPEVFLRSVDVPAVPSQLAYETVPPITVPAGTLPADVLPDSGVYKLGVVITYRTDQNTPTEMAAFSDGPMFLLREP